MKNDAYYHGYDDAKYGFTYVSDDVKAYEAGFKAYLDEQKKQNTKECTMNNKGLTPMSDNLKGVSLSEATMRPEDLIPCFISALRIIDSDNKGMLESLVQMEHDMDNPDYFESEDSQYDLDYLFDMLDSCAPDGYYFGAHPGDGSDYGFWECE